jgi:hypothetical protein
MPIADIFRLTHGSKHEPRDPSAPRRPGARTGAFSALEADFFASAADLHPDAVTDAEAWEMRLAAAKARR